ncbi:MAG: hypothetical protein PUK40_06375 [Actinomycetaceae bacterium]|nr:hypothetical protein [Actinomycetaceae bacterium]
MDITIEEILTRYNDQVGALTQRAILAETQAAALQLQVNELETRLEHATTADLHEPPSIDTDTTTEGEEC